MVEGQKLILGRLGRAYYARIELAKRAKIGRLLDRRERSLSLWLTRLIAFLAACENAVIVRALRGRIERFLDATTDCVVNLIALPATWTPAF